MSLPAQVTSALSDGMTDAVTLAGLSLSIFIAIKAMQFMRSAVDGGSTNETASIRDRIDDRALDLNAEKDDHTYEGWKANRAEAANEITREQKYF